MCHHTALTLPVTRHPSLSPLSVSLAALRSVGGEKKGIRRTLLDTSVYNSCPAPKIERFEQHTLFRCKK